MKLITQILREKRRKKVTTFISTVIHGPPLTVPEIEKVQ